MKPVSNLFIIKIRLFTPLIFLGFRKVPLDSVLLNDMGSAN